MVEVQPSPRSAPTTDNLLTASDVARRLGISVRSIRRRLVEDGSLTVVRIGRAVRIRPTALDRFVEKNTSCGSGYGAGRNTAEEADS